MRPILIFSVGMLLAAQAASAEDGTMFKCVDARGHTAYTELPCPAEATASRQLAVLAPENAQASTARVAQEKHKRRMASDSMRRQMDARSEELDARTQDGPGPAASASYGDDGSSGSPLCRARGVGGQSSGSSGAQVKR